MTFPSRAGLCLMLLQALIALHTTGSAVTTNLAQLREQIEIHIAQPKFSQAAWGIKVASLDTGKVLYERNAQKLLSPASNSKLYTVALALDQLGGEYRIRTSLYAKAPPRNGVLNGDLIVYGRGDPSLNTRLHNDNIYEALFPLVAALTNAGVRKITGDLVADDSFFHGPEFGSGWAWDDLEYYYGAEISALSINDNILQVTVVPGQKVGMPCTVRLAPQPVPLTVINRTLTGNKGQSNSITIDRPPGQRTVYVAGEIALESQAHHEQVTMPEPASFFALWFREALKRNGVKVQGTTRTVHWLDRPDAAAPDNCSELAWIESPNIREIAREIQKPSQNLYTDLLLAHIGEKAREPEKPHQTSEELGIMELNRFLCRAEVAEGDVLFEEGSGLSRNNLTTARATVALLTHMSSHPWAEAYVDALPIAGVDGSLRSRMRGTAAAGNLRGKTGSLRWAHTLSGYVTSAAGERLVFAVMLNRFHNTDPNTTVRQELDALAILLASFAGRSQ